MYFTYRLMVFGLLVPRPAVFAAPTSEDDDIYAEATDARSLELPAPHPSLVDWREFLDGPLPVASKICLKDWNTRKQICYDKLKDKARVKDVERASGFDAYWDAVSECMRRASHYECRPGLFPAHSKSFLNICTKQHQLLLPHSLVSPAPDSGFRTKWSSTVAAVASEAKPISVPESGVTQPESRSQALLHHVGTVVQALVGNSHHVMERIWKAGPALSPLLNRLAHAHAPAPAVPLKAFEY
ncbi:MAG: hypothetical protein M1826_007142 [Phylliscum demangeonii]|nr:MAG: hypothetical protein M1826_007142 [Phylliscum demangeonii]